MPMTITFPGYVVKFELHCNGTLDTQGYDMLEGEYVGNSIDWKWPHLLYVFLIVYSTFGSPSDW